MDGYLRCIRDLEQECGSKEGASAGNLEAAIIKICRTNKQMSKYISAVKKYERDVLRSPKILLYGEPLSRIRGMKKESSSQGKKLSNSEKTYMNKINRLNDKKLKLAFRLQQKSGLRVDELSKLTKRDIEFNEDNRTLKVYVKLGKGSKSRIVDVLDDQYLYENLKEFLYDLVEGEVIFYTASYLMKMAWKYEMETHDLRRINSRERFREEIAGGATRRKARSAVAQELGHDDPKITNVYLGDEWGGTANDEQSET